MDEHTWRWNRTGGDGGGAGNKGDDGSELHDVVIT